MAADTLLEARDLTVRYAGESGDVTALADVSFALRRGESVGVLGESGCGKTSLALAILGLLPPTGSVVAGELLFRGRSILGLGEGELRRLRGAEIGLVHQEPDLALHPTRRVGEQVAEVLRAHRPSSLFSRRRCRDEAAALLAEVDLGDEGLVDAYPHQLSGGQRQRVVLAQAIACRPALVIADEPTTALDAVTEGRVLALLRRLRERLGAAFLLISHDPRVLAGFTDRLLVLAAGRVVAEGPTAALLRRSAPVPSFRWPAAGAAAPPAVPLVRAVELTQVYRRRSRRGSEVVTALDRVSLEVPAGATVALVGASGSGKSTLARCLALLEEPVAGEVWVEGGPTVGLDRRRKRDLRPRLQLVFQDPASALDSRFTAVEAVAEPLLVRGGLSPAERRDRALAHMAEVGLGAELAGRSTLELSGGQKRRLVIARALAAAARLLILDEGLTGLDPSLQAQIVELLADLRERHGLAYLVISHDLRLVARLADTVAVLDGGRLVESGPPTALLEEPRHAATRALVAAGAGSADDQW